MVERTLRAEMVVTEGRNDLPKAASDVIEAI
jgi:hypothetical protein